MSTKEEIKHLIDELPDKVLVDLLTYLKSLEKSQNLDTTFSKNLERILTEDKELLKELAK